MHTEIKSTIDVTGFLSCTAGGFLFGDFNHRTPESTDAVASWEAARWAAAEAVLRDRELRVITCDDRFNVATAGGTWEFAMAATAAYAEVRAELGQVCARLRDVQPGLRVESYLLWGVVR